MSIKEIVNQVRSPIKYLTLQEAAELYRIGYQTLYLAARRGDLRAYKPGRCILVEVEDMDAWFRSKKIVVAAKIGRPRKNATRRAA